MAKVTTYGVMEDPISVNTSNNNIGGYKNDKKHGFGKYTWADGRQYIGYWENGKQHGYGKYILEDSQQIGQWVKGKRVTWLSEEEIYERKSDAAFARILKSN
jgi:hypothetical protein